LTLLRNPLSALLVFLSWSCSRCWSTFSHSRLCQQKSIEDILLFHFIHSVHNNSNYVLQRLSPTDYKLHSFPCPSFFSSVGFVALLLYVLSVCNFFLTFFLFATSACKFSPASFYACGSVVITYYLLSGGFLCSACMCLAVPAACCVSVCPKFLPYQLGSPCL
jgi:hypothetical protein